LWTSAHCLDEIPGHAGEVEQPVRAHARERAYDFVHIPAGAEISAGSRDDDGTHLGGRHQRAEQVAQLGVGLEGERILALGSIQSHHADAVNQAPLKMARPEILGLELPTALSRFVVG
jgi:hypothetical protein